jgi:hypothetical protein
MSISWVEREAQRACIMRPLWQVFNAGLHHGLHIEWHGHLAIWAEVGLPRPAGEWYYQCLRDGSDAPGSGTSSGPMPTPNPSASTSAGNTGLWEQCGGKGGNCNAHAACVDGPYPGEGCAAGAFCSRINEWHYQCVPGGAGSGTASGSSSNAGEWHSSIRLKLRLESPGMPKHTTVCRGVNAAPA